MAHRTVGPEGCRYGHGPDRMARTPDGLWRCRTCLNQANVLRRARRTLPDLPPRAEFVAAHGEDAIDRLRLAMRKPASHARQADGSYRYARVQRGRSLDETLAFRQARVVTEWT
jgi:hypothetical protein